MGDGDMKRFPLIIFIILWAAVLYLSLINIAYAQNQYSLADALDMGIIKAKIQGTGDYYGSDAIYVFIYNNENYPVMIKISQGRLLVPDEEEYQTMVVAETYYVYLPPRDGRSMYIAAFCTEIDDEIPSQYTTFRVGSMADYDLMRVLKTIEDENLINDIDAQLAVWTVTDGPYKVKEKLMNIAEEENIPKQEIKDVLRNVQDILDHAGVGYKYRLIAEENENKGISGLYQTLIIIFVILIICLIIIKLK